MSGCFKKTSTGASDCAAIAKVSKRLVWVHETARDGTKNSIPQGTILNLAYFTARINDPDPTKRWNFITLSDNLTDERDTDIQETTDNNVIYNVQDGQRLRTVLLFEGGAKYKKELDKFKCIKLAFFDITLVQQIVGKSIEGSTDLFPRKINQKSLSNRLMPGTETTVEKIEVSFQYDQSEYDGNIEVIEPDSIANDVNLIELQSPLNVNGAATLITTTDWTLTLTEDYGDFFGPNPVVGWLAADFVFFNTTTSLLIVPVSVIETVPGVSGVYRVVVPAQGAGNNITVNDAKDGFDLTEVPILIP